MARGRRDRRKAIELGALDANELIATIPGLRPILNADQVQQIQDVLDAAVVNPVLKKQADDIYRRSVTLQIGSQVSRDPKMVAEADKIYDQMIEVTEKDYRIRLDLNKLLTADALTPRTDNPDEANYLAKVRNTLASRGVWLRISQPYVRDAGDPSRHIKDPRKWELWLSLGPEGDAIPTADGKIDRDELLSTTMLGAGYYRAVHTGHVQTALKKQLARLQVEITDGMEEHERLIRRRREAFFGVAEISDMLGRADLPSRSIWDRPHSLLVKALNANTGGNVLESQVYLVVAAIIVQSNAEALATYAERSGAGAAFAVKLLKVAKTAGQVADVGLTLTGVGAGVRAIRKGATTVAGDIAERKARDDAARKLTEAYTKKTGISSAELSLVEVVPGPKGSVAGGVKPGTSSGAGTGFHRYY